MKKWFYMLVFIIGLLNINTTCHAADGEYIFRIKESGMMLFSIDEDISYLGDDLYKSKDLESVYRFASKENIATIFPDYRLELFDADYPNVTSDTDFSKQWNLETISSVTAREKGVFGRGVKIAVLDSGLNTNHPDLKSANILQGYNCIENTSDVADISDNYGHGTMVCGIIAAQSDNQTGIAGISPDVHIVPLKITDQKDLWLSDIYTGIDMAIKLDCDIINMSLGGALTDEAAISEFKSWIDKANAAGIIIVAAVGNGGTVLNYPAAFENVIGVGSVDKNRNISVYSQQNESVFITAPGVDILSLSTDGNTNSDTGTSLATPHVSAAIALIKELSPDCTLNEIKDILKSTSIDLGDEGKDICYGYGLLNINAILDKLQDYVPDVVISQGAKDGTARIHIHNNTGKTITANGYFAKYQDKRLLDLNILHNIELITGVANNSFGIEYDCFMLWNSQLVPYTEKFVLEK